MALTPTRIGDPFTFGPFAAAFVSVLFDSAYLTTGEILTAAMAGMQSLVAVIPVGDAPTGAGTTGLGVRATVAASKLQAAIQLLETGAAVDTPFKELTSAADPGGSALLLVIGYA